MQYIISEEELIKFNKDNAIASTFTFTEATKMWLENNNKKPVTEIASGKFVFHYNSPTVQNKDGCMYLDTVSFWEKYEDKNITIYVEVNDAKR